MILLNSSIDTTVDNSINQTDMQMMDNEEIFIFNDLAQKLDNIEASLEGIMGYGADFEVVQALTHILMIKRRLHLSVITF